MLILVLRVKNPTVQFFVSACSSWSQGLLLALPLLRSTLAQRIKRLQSSAGFLYQTPVTWSNQIVQVEGIQWWISDLYNQENLNNFFSNLLVFKKYSFIYLLVTGCTHSMWKFLSEGLNPCHSSDNAGSLSPWAMSKFLTFFFLILNFSIKACLQCSVSFLLYSKVTQPH